MSVEPSWNGDADGVFRGGGVKGIALAGALEGMAAHPEKPVKEWVNVAGASAGAIIACYLAVGNSVQTMSELLRTMDFREFADFPLGRKALGYGRLLFRHGMARGARFEEWFEQELDGATFAKVRKPAEGRLPADWRLKLIAVDVTQKRLLVLPEDLADYRLPGDSANIVPEKFSIARAARMSMSIPYFFQPVELINGEGGVSTIVDGESHSTRVRSFASDAGDVATADFDLDDEQKAMLRENGRRAATEFLDEFSLAEYMNTYSSRIAA